MIDTEISSQAEILRRFHCSFSIVDLSFVIAGDEPFHNDKLTISDEQ
jgi:hypothetical protein